MILIKFISQIDIKINKKKRVCASKRNGIGNQRCGDLSIELPLTLDSTVVREYVEVIIGLDSYQLNALCYIDMKWNINDSILYKISTKKFFLSWIKKANGAKEVDEMYNKLVIKSFKFSWISFILLLNKYVSFAQLFDVSESKLS